MMKLRLACLLLSAAFGLSAEEAYLFSYFSDRSSGGRKGEAAGLHLAYSYDGKTWAALNRDEPLLVPSVGKDRLMRDPSICRGPDGTFHLVWTSSWKDRIIGYASSKDLLHWSAQAAIPVMAHEPAARNCWAPELTYNPDDGLFYIYWATTIPGRHSPIAGMDKKEGGLNHRIYLTTTSDFKSFSPTRLWFNPDFSAIDAAVARDPVEQDWVMVVKNENHTPAEKNIRVTRTKDLASGFPAAVSAKISPDWVEGPSPLFVGDSLYVYFDCYTKHRFGAVRSDDRGRTWTDVSAEVSFPRGIRHGTAFAVDKSVVENLLRHDRTASPEDRRFHEVEIRRAGEADWCPLALQQVDVAEMRDGRKKVRKMDVAKFSFPTAVEVRVRRNAPWSAAAVRPQSKGIAVARGEDGWARFTLDQPFLGVVEFDGQRFDNLAIFADRPLVPTGDETHAFGPGRHVLSEPLLLKSGESLWLDEQAVVDGTVVVSNACGVSIRGLGTLRPKAVGVDGRPGIRVANSRDVTIDGPFLTTCPIGGSVNVSVSNLKSVSATRWGDGLNVFSCTNVVYNRVFARNSDDCTTVYATRLGFKGGVKGVTMTDAVLWADIAHPIMIGIHGNADVGETIEDLVYRNIDILDQMEMQVDYQGAMAINCGDANTVRNVLFDDIRIENLRLGSLCHMKTVYNEKYCAAPGRLVENITFRNVKVDSDRLVHGLVTAYDANHPVRNVVFENLVINGQPVTDTMKRRPGWYKTADFVPLYVGPFVEGLQFK